MALREIRRHKMRSALTTLGIVIGVGAVVALVTVGEASAAKVRADVALMGNNLLQVIPGTARRGPARSSAKPFHVEDALAIQAEIGEGGVVAPVLPYSGVAVVGNSNHNTSVWGTTENYITIRGFQIESGRMFNDSEQGLGVCVLGATVREQLFGGRDPVGENLRIGGGSCRVIGTLVAKGANAWGSDQDDMILMPLTTVQRRLHGSKDVNSIVVSVEREAAIPRVKSQIESLMRERRRVRPGMEADFFVHDLKEVAEAMQAITGTMTALLSAIAAVSLLVGGIGIMNIMMVSVTERTREIGIRKAVGAKSRHVLLQFLVESITLSSLGGIVGVLLGVAAGWYLARAGQWAFAVEPVTIALALGFALAVGLFFGVYPAWRASRLDPIEALRYE